MAQRLRAGVVWANTYNRFDPASPFGGYKESGFGREGGLHGLEPYLRSRGGMTTVSRQEDVQAVHRRGVPPLGVGPDLRGGGAERRACLAEGRPRRGQGRPRRRREVGGDDGVQPWAGAVPRCGDDGGALHATSGSCRPAGRRSRRRSTASSGTQGGRTSCAGDRSSNPVAGPYFNFTVPEPTGVVGVLAPEEPALLGLVTRLAPVLVGGNAAVVVASESSRSPPWSSPRWSRPRTSPAASSTS